MSTTSHSSKFLAAQGYHHPNITSPPTTSSEYRWSDVIPPKTALQFAVFWDSDDLVLFSDGELLEDSRTEDLLGSPLSPSDACSQVVSLGQSTIPLSDKSSTLLYFRDHLGPLIAEDSRPPTSDSQERSFLGRTQTSSTLEGLDVYLRGSLFGQAHRDHRYYSCLEDLDGKFEFDPRTSFAKEYLRNTETKEIIDDTVTDEGFFEVNITSRRRARDGKSSHLRPNSDSTGTSSTSSTTRMSDFVSIEDDGASSDWSTVEAPEFPSYSEYPHGRKVKQRPHKRRLTKPRPAEIPAPPSEVLQREVFSHQVSLPPWNIEGSRSTKQDSKMFGIACSRSKKKAAEEDRWLCIEVSPETRRRIT
ncbi:hypothetical protein EV360DRAFT_80618 [Lentinula raphanica]|nr:hypothetical protein EV360DRAFT_80618 [Lentinula raphanica]